MTYLKGLPVIAKLSFSTINSFLFIHSSRSFIASILDSQQLQFPSQPPSLQNWLKMRNRISSVEAVGRENATGVGQCAAQNGINHIFNNGAVIVQSDMTTPLQVAKDLFCGCMSGWGQVISMLPFENIKIKVVSKPQEYNQGYLHALRKTISQEGLMSLYKGMLFPLIGVGAQVSVQFGFVESLKKIMKRRFADEKGQLHYQYSFLSGLLCGIPSAIVVTPLDHSRFKVTLNKEKGQGSVKMAGRILKEHGLRKLYLGFYPTMLRESIGLGCYFGVYDALIKNFTHNGNVNLWGSMLAGGFAGLGFWAFIYPIDYIKTVVQADSLTQPKFKGSWHCAMEEAKGGYQVFFRGFGIMIARAFVVNAFGFLCFELGKKMVY